MNSKTATFARPLTLAAGLSLLMPLTSLADDIPCRSMLKEIAPLSADSQAYKAVIRNAIDPAIKSRLEDVSLKRNITAGTAKGIHQLYFEIFVNECNANPNVYTYATSRLAGKKTKELVQDYFNLR